MSNRFAVLFESDTDEDITSSANQPRQSIAETPLLNSEDKKICWSLDRIKEWDYTLERGNDHPLIHFINANLQQKYPKFYGYCYSCGCPMHSQNFCPIRRCKQCLMYGHSLKVCPLRKRFAGMD
jgi:hypothetical protein